MPQGHILRSTDRFVDLSGIGLHLAPIYSHTGRPSVDPELLIRTSPVGYCLGIWSERRLCEEVHLNLAYRWFCRLDLADAAFGAATTVEPKFTFHTDPSRQWTAARKGPAFFAYSTNDMIDTDNAVIVDVEGDAEQKSIQ